MVSSNSFYNPCPANPECADLIGTVTGYNSNAALGLHERLLRPAGGEPTGWNIHSRVLGNVFYLMASQISSHEKIQAVEARLMEAIR